MKISKNIKNMNVKVENKINKNLNNMYVKFENKNIDWYLLNIYPDMCYNYYPKSIFTTLMHEPKPQIRLIHNLSHSYNRCLSKIGLTSQAENTKRLYDIRGQNLMIGLNPFYVSDNIYTIVMKKD